MKVRARHVRIPMRYRFGHARAARSVADNIIVEVELSDGARGYGESVPRDYVTGETIASVRAAVHEAKLPEQRDLRTAADDLSTRDLAAELGPTPQLAAACALELAILDAHARREQRSVLEAVATTRFASLLRAPQESLARVRQTLTLGDDLDGALDRAGTITDVLDIKLKVGLDDDTARLARVRALFPQVDLRGDANGAFSLDAARAIGTTLTSLEEPLAARNLVGCAQLRQDGVRVMLDESLCTLDDARRAQEAGAVDLFNLRLSKNGGLFGTLRLVELAQQHALGWQLGCMVGESGILSSLGRLFVAHVAGARYFESTVPSRSLEADLTDAALDHAPGTRMTAVPTGVGFGASMKLDVLERYTVG